MTTEKKQRRKKRGENDSMGKLIASVSSTAVSVLLVAALCSAGAKGSFPVQPPMDIPEDVPIEQPSFPDDPSVQPSFPDETHVGASSDSENVNGGSDTRYYNAETGDGETEGKDTETDRHVEEQTKEPVTKPPVSKPPVTEPTVTYPTHGIDREYYSDEHYIGGFDKDGIKLSVSKVERGELNYFICDIKVSSPRQLQTALAGGKLTGRLYTSKIASSVGASFAVNGDFAGFRSEGIIIRQGNLLRNNTRTDWDLLYMDRNGNLQTCLNNSADGNDLISQGVLQTWCFGPTLVKNGQVMTEFNTPDLSRTAKEPRTAIGQVSELHYIILVVDQVRSPKKSGGMSFAQLAEEFENLGCKTAYNLDGGGSTTLYFNGAVINSPCMKGERQVSDILYLK